AGFGSPTAEGMVELTPDATDSLLPSLACALDPEIALLVGYLDGNPVSTAELFVVGTIAGITGVATVPAYRRRGLAAALTWAVQRRRPGAGPAARVAEPGGDGRPLDAAGIRPVGGGWAGVRRLGRAVRVLGRRRVARVRTRLDAPPGLLASRVRQRGGAGGPP